MPSVKPSQSDAVTAPKTIMGLAVAVDDSFWYAIPTNQSLQENWTKTKCRWMYPALRSFGAHPAQPDSDMTWFVQDHSASSDVFSYSRFGIVTFYGIPHPDNDAFTTKYVWGLPREVDVEMQGLYNAFLVREAQAAEAAQAAAPPSPQPPSEAPAAVLAPLVVDDEPAVVVDQEGRWCLTDKTVRRGATAEVPALVLNAVPDGPIVEALCINAADVQLLIANGAAPETIDLSGDAVRHSVVWRGSWPTPKGWDATVVVIQRPTSGTTSVAKPKRSSTQVPSKKRDREDPRTATTPLEDDDVSIAARAMNMSRAKPVQAKPQQQAGRDRKEKRERTRLPALRAATQTDQASVTASSSLVPPTTAAPTSSAPFSEEDSVMSELVDAMAYAAVMQRILEPQAAT